MEAVCGSAHYQIAAYWSRVLNKPAIKAYQASRRGIVLTANYTATQKGVDAAAVLSGEVGIDGTESFILHHRLNHHFTQNPFE